MDLTIPQEVLSYRLSQWGKQQIESRQAWRRMHDLLPRYQKKLERQQGENKTVAQKKRLAILHPDYLDYIDRCLDVQEQALRAKIQRETHLMLYNARKLVVRLNRDQY